MSPDDTPEPPEWSMPDHDWDGEEPAYLVEERRSAFHTLNDNDGAEWWVEHEREEAAKEAAATQPPPPDPDEQPEYRTPEEELEAALLTGSAILDIPPPEPLIEGWLNLDSVAVMYGRPKGGKSFVAIDMAMCIAAGRRWHNRHVAQGPVLYVIAEGVRGIGPRVRAWSKVNSHAVPENLIWLPRAVSMLNPQWSGALASVAAQLQPRMVVIDTLNRSMAGGDENSSKDMGIVIAAADLIKRSTGACVFIVHHSGKDSAQGARGHSSLLGAVDTELEVKNDSDVITLSNTAQKDAADALPLRFTLEEAAGTHSVAIVDYRGQVSGDMLGLSKGCAEALEILREIQIPGGIPTGVWEAECLEVGIAHTSFYRYRARLVELEQVVNLGTEKMPRYLVPPPLDEGSTEAVA